MKKFLLLFIPLVIVIIAASYPPPASVPISGGFATNNTFYGATNYFDTSAGTNGPWALGVQHGSLNLLIQDLIMGGSSKFFLNFDNSPGDSAYGQLFINTIHNGPTPSGPNTEWQFAFPSHVAFTPGFGNANSGRFQFGSGSGNFGYGLANAWQLMINAQPLAQNSSTGFSCATVYGTSELQGANEVDHYPGFMGYSIRTNAPGRWATLIFGELNQGNVGGTAETWDPNTAKKMTAGQFQWGDITNLFMSKPINYATNLGSAAIDCSIPECDISTAVGITFTSPVNFDGMQKQYENPLMHITNSAAGTITLTAPANARLFGSTTVTRMSDVQWRIKIGFWTNGFITTGF